jgi:aminoglycoside phosphotransferase (APT) family kinase protein
VLAAAHDMGREYRVITALHGTEAPVPATYALCADAEVTGAQNSITWTAFVVIEL